eukprot:3394881-Prymnesium_polylepis.1
MSGVLMEQMMDSASDVVPLTVVAPTRPVAARDDVAEVARSSRRHAEEPTKSHGRLRRVLRLLRSVLEREPRAPKTRRCADRCCVRSTLAQRPFASAHNGRSLCPSRRVLRVARAASRSAARCSASPCAPQCPRRLQRAPRLVGAHRLEAHRLVRARRPGFGQGSQESARRRLLGQRCADGRGRRRALRVHARAHRRARRGGCGAAAERRAPPQPPSGHDRRGDADGAVQRAHARANGDGQARESVCRVFRVAAARCGRSALAARWHRECDAAPQGRLAPLCDVDLPTTRAALLAVVVGRVGDRRTRRRRDRDRHQQPRPRAVAASGRPALRVLGLVGACAGLRRPQHHRLFVRGHGAGERERRLELRVGPEPADPPLFNGARRAARACRRPAAAPLPPG